MRPRVPRVALRCGCPRGLGALAKIGLERPRDLADQIFAAGESQNPPQLIERAAIQGLPRMSSNAATGLGGGGNRPGRSGAAWQPLLQNSASVSISKGL